MNKTTRTPIPEPDIIKMLELERTGLSHSKIAAIMGRTKNSVTGALNRRRAKIKSCDTHIAKLKKPKNKIPPLEKIESGLTIFQLKEDTCRAIIGEHRYCGDIVRRGSYCRTHGNEYYQKREKL
jgi:hypothetical protein